MSRGRVRSSKIWTTPLEIFRKIISESRGLKEALTLFGLENKGGNHLTLKKRAKEEGISLEHFASQYTEWIKGRTWAASARPLEEILVEHSSYNRVHLKRRLLKEGRLQNICSLCGLLPMWNDKPLVLRLDHTNGVNYDSRESNLRLVCPNCDSQLPTFCARNKVNTKVRPVKVLRKRVTKIDWPEDDALLFLASVYSKVVISKQLGVSDTAVGKRLKRILADRPTVGHGTLTAGIVGFESPSAIQSA